MDNEDLKIYTTVRIHSICRQIENKKYETVGKIGLTLMENNQPKNFLSQSMMNFLFGKKSFEKMDKEKHLKLSVKVAKYIRQNSLLPNVDEMLVKKYPEISYVKRILLALNSLFDGCREAAPKGLYNYRLKEKERE